MKKPTKKNLLFLQWRERREKGLTGDRDEKKIGTDR